MKAPTELCPYCGYWAYSIASGGIYDEDGKEVGAELHRCPTCNDAYWLLFQGFGRDDRAAILAAGPGVPLSESIWKDSP